MDRPVNPDAEDLIRRRQKERALLMALLLGAFVLLIFFITMAKLGLGK